MGDHDSGWIQELIEEIQRMKEEFEKAEVRCGIIGLSGCGKSSLINAIAGERIAEVGGYEDTTSEPQEFSHGGIVFVDLPGCGTEKWPQDSYIRRLGLMSYDLFIIVTSDRLYESDLYLYRVLSAEKGKPCFVVRTKIDQVIEAEKRDNGRLESETLEKARKSLIENIRPTPKTVYLTSAWYPTKWDLPKLLEDIPASQKGAKNARFTADMAALSRNAIREKRKVADKVVSWSAIESAANGINPIPGVDIAVDVGILVKMSSQIRDIFCFSDRQIESLPATLRQIFKQRSAQFAAKYITRAGIMLILKRMGSRIAIKNIGRFIPIVGQIASAAIGYKMTLSFGERVADDAEALATELFDRVVRESGEDTTGLLIDDGPR